MSGKLSGGAIDFWSIRRDGLSTGLDINIEISGWISLARPALCELKTAKIRRVSRPTFQSDVPWETFRIFPSNNDRVIFFNRIHHRRNKLYSSFSTLDATNG